MRMITCETRHYLEIHDPKQQQLAMMAYLAAYLAVYLTVYQAVYQAVYREGDLLAP